MSWLGLTVGLLALGVNAFSTDAPSTTEASYRAMKLFADWLIPPVALVALASGLVLSFGTPWGLVQHRWIAMKLWLTLITLAATACALRPAINHAAATVLPDGSLVAAPSVATSAYLFMTAISVLKPWGLTRRGRRLRTQAAARQRLDGGFPPRTP